MKKKFFILIIITILCLSGFVFYKKHTKTEATYHILSIGDSLTESKYGSYVLELNEILIKNKIGARAISAARPGNTSGEYLKYLQHSNILIRINPKIILMLLGTNDVRTDSDKTFIVDYIKNMQGIINLLKDHKNNDGSKPLIFMMSVPSIFNIDLSPFNETSKQRINDEINPAVKKLVKKNKLKLINLNGFFKKNPKLLPGIHPSKPGYKRMARFIYKKIRIFMEGSKPDREEKLPPEFKGKIAFQSDRMGNEDIFIIDHQGVVQVTRDKAEDGYPVFSPDGKNLVFESNRSGKYEIYLKNLKDQTLIKLFSTPTEDRYPFWTYDSKYLYFTRSVKGKYQVFRFDFESKEIQQITDYSGKNALPAVSPSGKHMLITSNKLLGWHVHQVDLITNKAKKFSIGYGGCRGKYSHRGDKIVWVSHKIDKKGDLFLTDFDKFEPLRLTTNSEKHDYFPCFSPDDKYIVYACGPNLKTGNYNIQIIDLNTRRIWQITSNPAKDILPYWAK